jgi:hypothetical protein
MAGIFGPDNNPIWFDNVTIGEYISDMADRLPYHAFNAYDQVAAAQRPCILLVHRTTDTPARNVRSLAESTNAHR